MYQVIQFEQLPYPDIDKYVCVPISWIRWRDETNGKVVVAYPEEDPAITRKYVENDTKCSSDWKCFLGNAEFTANSYVDAVNFIEYLKRKSNSETDNRNEEPKSQRNDDGKKQRKRKSLTITYDKEYSTSGDENEDVPSSAKSQTKYVDRENERRKRKKIVYSDTSSDEEYIPGDESEDESSSESLETCSSADECEIEDDPSNLKDEKPKKVVLPPEYDPYSPRWCLKYPNSNGRRDLYELKTITRHKTGIYVKRRRFYKCLHETDDDRSFARKLLIEIFNKSALRVCTLTGRGPEGRPGLYVRAVNALIYTVFKYYHNSDEAILRSCLSAKLYHLRNTL